MRQIKTARGPLTLFTRSRPLLPLKTTVTLLLCPLAPPASLLSLVPPHVALHGVGWGTLLGTVSSKCLFCGTCLPEWTAGSLIYCTEAPLCSAVAQVLLTAALKQGKVAGNATPGVKSVPPDTPPMHTRPAPARHPSLEVSVHHHGCRNPVPSDLLLLSPRPSLFWPPPGSRPSWCALPRKCWRRAPSHPTLSLFSIFFPSQQSAKVPRGQGRLCNLCHCTSSKPGTR